MHILTKVFVLFAAVLSILMAALSISYTVNADRIVADYRNALAAADLARNDRDASKSIQSNLIAAKEEELSASRDELATREADIRRLEAANSELRINLRSAESARESITAKIAELGVAVETQAKIIDEYKNELSRLRTAELDYRDERIDLERQISDLESQVIVFEQVKRALEEQLVEVRNALADATATGGVTATAGAPRQPQEIPGPPVRGAVDQVMVDDATGQLLVKVNLGSNDRVRQNSRLYVHRGTTYLGELVIFQVDLNHSIGRVAYTAQGQQIRANDSVLSRLSSN
ncbi:MAG: hypothetical protein LAT64_02445 [Phycisphaerales bacterium]|nr:hypothetical protein [Planctomycetota bacterium]MCH8507618.1 hypothetical protein [Phycisphaerales bacterium]